MIPAVFIPGLLCTNALFEGQDRELDGLLEIEFGAYTQDDRIEPMAERILEGAPPEFLLLGFSMGGVIAQEILRIAPDRVRGLVLLNSGARADLPDQAAKRLAYISFAEECGLDEAMRKSLPLLLHEDRLGDKRLVDRVFEMARELGMDVFYRQQHAIAHRRDYRPYLEAISCPTLVIGSDADVMTPLKLSEELVAGIPATDYEIISDCGHLSLLERPKEINALLKKFVAEKILGVGR